MQSLRYFNVTVFNFLSHSFLTILLTCRLLHPSKIPSSIALIPFPLKSRSCKFFSPRNSLVENMGFNVSRNRLSANRSSRRVDCSPWSSLSVSLLKELPEKSTVLSGKADLENIWNTERRQSKYIWWLIPYF